MMMTASEDRSTRTKGLIALAFALLVGVAGWFGMGQATERGVARLAAIDVAREQCERSWIAAKSQAETLLVDRIALADTIDPQSDDALMQCGDLRDKGSAQTLPNNREMSGEAMPRGLR
jgi:hypothetical protein